MSTQEKRTITVFSTKGKRVAKIETDVTSWGELRKLVRKEGYDVDSLHATENITRHDLTNETAVIPTTPFTLFLRPKKTKSGGKDYDSMGFKQLRAELTAEDKTAMSEMFGKNYTRCSTDNLKTYLKSKLDSSTPSTEEVVEESASVSEVVESVKSLSNLDRAKNAKTLLNTIFDNTESEEVQDRVDIVSEELDSLILTIECEESPEKTVAEQKAEEEAAEQKRLAEEAKAAEEAEKKALADEAKSLMGGY